MIPEIRIATTNDRDAFDRVAPGVFDHPIRFDQLAAFLAHTGHAIAIAIEDRTIIGFASGNLYLHPDKPPQAWINEVSVAPTFRRRGIAKRLIRTLEGELHALGASAVWLATEQDNAPARATSRSLSYTETEGIVMYEQGDHE